MNVDFHHQIEVVQQAFRAARGLIMARDTQAITTYKTDGSPVTDIDIEAEQRMTRYIQDRIPGVLIFGEESGYDDTRLPETCWLIDPIDGTKSYLKNIPAFTSMGVLIHQDEAVASVIYNPTTDDMYHALAGQGAFCNSKRLDLTSIALPKQIFCKSKVIAVLGALLQEKSVTAKIGPSGAGYGFSLVASGQTAARFHLYSGPHIHDHAPGALLVREAGGDIIPVFEDTYILKTRSFIACHPELTELVQTHLDTIRSIEDPGQALC